MVPEQDTVLKCLSYYTALRDWDAAFDVIARNRLELDLERLAAEALDELLDTARLQTIEAWCETGATFGLQGPALSLARSEVALRRGHLAEAQVFAELAASEDSDVRFRALSVGGRAAHIASREEEALELYRRAEAAALTHVARRDALWGQLICATALELPEAPEMLRSLVAGVSRSSTREVLQSATYEAGCRCKFGHLDLASADAAYHLLSAVDDPLVVSSFQSLYSSLLGLGARYDDALRVSEELLITTHRYRLEFAIPYALASAATASAGLRKWRQAERYAAESLALSHQSRDVAAQQHVFGKYLRVLAQQRRYRTALTIAEPSLKGALPGIHAEILLCRALILASVGRVEEARRMTVELVGSTAAVEATVLGSAVSAISALKLSEPDALQRVAELEEVAFATGGLDMLVTAYRSTPELLPVLLRGSRTPERIGRLLTSARDEELATAVGHFFSDESDVAARLSTREKEVYALLAQGLTNLQIAQLLFITEGTVKVHVHHIYDKLGVRSRTALVVQALLDRSDHATSAMKGEGVSSS
jgi:DNA-binding CsgD family transcriptional regulator/tetratricopeptide (TPR) repeat protein